MQIAEYLKEVSLASSGMQFKGLWADDLVFNHLGFNSCEFMQCLFEPLIALAFTASYDTRMTEV